jgi:membrane-bound serine protease (ClpP class)
MKAISRRLRLLCLPVALAGILASPGHTAPAAPADAPQPAAASEATSGAPEVFRVRIDSIIHPIARDLLVDTLDRADREGAAAVVVELDTPGGLMTSMREMTTAMLGAKTPVVVWVAPEGAQAASAGFFLLMASDFAAMAPSTNTGAAHPVGGQGEDIAGNLGKKVEEDSAANIRALAARRGRNVELAQKAVIESKSFTAKEALDDHLIELVAPDLDSVLAGLDGRSFEKPKGQERTLRVAGAKVHDFEMNAVQSFLSALLHPNIAYLLMTLGMLGLYFELAHPGAVFPGVLGGISLLLGLYALSVLPVRFAGVALILLGLGMLIAEIKVTSYGLLTVGGLTSFVLGSLILFRSPEPALRLSLTLVGTIAGFFLALTVFLVYLAVRGARYPVQVGPAALVGARAEARTALAPKGKVFVAGEWWNAVSDVPVQAGAEVEIIAVEGMVLRVRPVATERS